MFHINKSYEISSTKLNFCEDLELIINVFFPIGLYSLYETQNPTSPFQQVPLGGFNRLTKSNLHIFDPIARVSFADTANDCQLMSQFHAKKV